MTEKEMFKELHDIGLVPVIAIDDAEKAVPLAGALIQGGIPCAEITFRTSAAADAIRRISDAYPEMIVGAGTVLNPETAEKAVIAGAKFIVSPGFDRETVKWCEAHGVPIVPGVATPTEIQSALECRRNVLKFFPCEAMNGLKMLKNFAGPFGSVRFMVTGGINADNLDNYAKEKNILAVGGSWMADRKLIAADDWNEITRRCREAVKTLLGIRLIHVGINCEDSAEAYENAEMFAGMGLILNDGDASIFMDRCVELMKKPFLGKNGHIAFKCNDIERTLHHLKANGFTVNESTVKYDEKGYIKVAYLNEEIGGFAIHFI